MDAGAEAKQFWVLWCISWAKIEWFHWACVTGEWLQDWWLCGNELMVGVQIPLNVCLCQQNPTILACIFFWKSQQRGQGHNGHRHQMRFSPFQVFRVGLSWSTLAGQLGGHLCLPWLNCTCLAAEQRILHSRLIVFTLLIRISAKTERCCYLERALIIKLRYLREYTP